MSKTGNFSTEIIGVICVRMAETVERCNTRKESDIQKVLVAESDILLRGLGVLNEEQYSFVLVGWKRLGDSD